MLEQCRRENAALSYPGAVSTVGAFAATPLPTCSQTLVLGGGTSVTYTPTGTSPTFTSYRIVTNNSGGSGRCSCHNSSTSGAVTSGGGGIAC